jgi:hypothetical protein
MVILQSHHPVVTNDSGILYGWDVCLPSFLADVDTLEAREKVRREGGGCSPLDSPQYVGTRAKGTVYIATY